MQIKRKDVVKLWTLLNGISQEKMKVKVAYAIVKNKRLLDAEVKTIQELQQQQQTKLPLDQLDKFEEKRIEICKECAEKDESGNPKELDNAFLISKDRKEYFEEQIRLLAEQNKEVLTLKRNLETEFQELLNGEIEVDLMKISLDDLNAEFSPLEFEILEPILEV